MSNNSEQDAAEYMVELMNAQGVAISTVKDGHVLLFTRAFLEGLLGRDANQQHFSIFLKRPDFKD